MLLVLIDRRFEPLWDEFEAATGGPRGVVEHEIAAALERREAEPRSLEAVVHLMSVLRTAGRAAEAVAIGESVLPKLTGADPLFDDLREQATWFLDGFAFALADVGRMDEAHATMAAASSQLENRDGWVAPNVNQMLNGGWLLAMDGKPREALAHAAEVFQRSWSTVGHKLIVICARAQLDADEQVAIGRVLIDLERGRGAAYQTALHCLGRTDEARELMIWRLESERHRLDALVELQDLAEPEYVPPFEQRREDAWRVTRDDPEVRALAEQYGRLRSWDVVRLAY